MIDLAALKEQLRLLGHDLPDDQVVGILREMNIDFSDETDNHVHTAGASSVRASDEHAQVPLRTGSILDNIQGRQPSQARDSVTDAAQEFHYGYTSPAQARGLGADRPNNFHARRPEASSAYINESGDDGDDDREPDLSCRYCRAEGEAAHQDAYGYTGDPPNGPCRQGPREGDASLPLMTGSGAEDTQAAHRRDAHRDVRRSCGAGDLADCMQHMNMAGPARLDVSKPQHVPAAGKWPGDSGATAGGPALRPPAACHKQQVTTGKDQTNKPTAMRASAGRSYAPQPSIPQDEESDVALTDPDKDLLGLGASLQDLMHMQRHRAWLNHDAPGAGATQTAGRASASQPLGAGPYAGWLGGHHVGQDALHAGQLHARRPLSPQASDRSFESRASSRCSSASKARPKKVDRVQRYQQLQQEWSQSRFLKQGGASTRGTNRKPINFHNHFASLHAAEEVERQRMLREARTRTKQELGAAKEAPTANRRDELRWQTRMRLREQT